MKPNLRHIVFACFMSLWLSTSAVAMHEDTRHPASAETGTARMIEHAYSQYAFTDELWLIGSFLVSLTGLVIVVRFLHR